VSKKIKTQQVITPSTALSGISTSVVFTSVQGLQLSNPQIVQEMRKKGVSSSKYFDIHGTFSKLPK
jgi:hypothetical protein